MAKHFLWGGKMALSAVSALLAATLLITGCDDPIKTDDNPPISNKPGDGGIVPPQGLPIGPGLEGGIGLGIDVPPVAGPIPSPLGLVQVMVRTTPAEPQNEEYLDDWRLQVFTIDDQARPTSPTYFGEVGADGTALLPLPSYMFSLPMVISAYNEAFPFIPRIEERDPIDPEDIGECRLFKVFVPPFCADKGIWMVGPFENVLWEYYENAAKRRGEAWNPSQVDCATWLANLQLLLLTDQVNDELHDMNLTPELRFDPEAFVNAIQENQQLLTPTRPPICMAERRHDGGRMEPGEAIAPGETTLVIDQNLPPFGPKIPVSTIKPVVVNLTDGLVQSICDVNAWTDQVLLVNGVTFVPTQQNLLSDKDFMGTVSTQPEMLARMDVRTFNTRLTNGRPFKSDVYNQACAMTTITEFTNLDDHEQDLITNTGATFFNLFGVDPTAVYLTSNGDAVVDDTDTWAIFVRDRDNEIEGEEVVLAVELLGIRQEEWRDPLHMTYDIGSEDLFLGLRADWELNEDENNGESAFLAFTMSVWDGSSRKGRIDLSENISDCYQAADVWAREFFITQDFLVREDETCCADEDCQVVGVISPLEAAEFAVRSQCFSNSRANGRWRNDESGWWSINADKGVNGNVVVNPGWLAPFLDFEVFIQRFDEAVFKGPLTIATTDDVGQLLIDLPTIVEGDRILLRSQEACCNDYDLVLPCVPEFTGFAGAPGVPYVPVTVGPTPVPIPVPVGPGPGPIGPGPIGPGPGGPGGPLGPGLAGPGGPIAGGIPAAL